MEKGKKAVLFCGDLLASRWWAGALVEGWKCGLVASLEGVAWSRDETETAWGDHALSRGDGYLWQPDLLPTDAITTQDLSQVSLWETKKKDGLIHENRFTK